MTTFKFYFPNGATETYFEGGSRNEGSSLVKVVSIEELTDNQVRIKLANGVEELFKNIPTVKRTS